MLVIHDDADVLDLLTRAFEAAEVDVLTALTVYRAQTHLAGERAVASVVALWDRTHELGGEVYRWALAKRPDLRSYFVFLADEVAPGFDALVAGRCLALPVTNLAELVRVTIATATRSRTPPVGIPTFTIGPNLLLVDDDPAMLDAMAALLSDAGYNVTLAGSCRAAIEQLARGEFDLIVNDWELHDGSGADVYAWIGDHKPELARRVVFLSDFDREQGGAAANERPVLRKGQDSRALIELLQSIVEESRS